MREIPKLHEGMVIYFIETYSPDPYTRCTVQKDESPFPSKSGFVLQPDDSIGSYGIDEDWEKYLGIIYFLTEEDVKAHIKADHEKWEEKISTRENLLKALFNGWNNEFTSSEAYAHMKARIFEEFGVEV